jgi:hypothetical protein
MYVVLALIGDSEKGRFLAAYNQAASSPPPRSSDPGNRQSASRKTPIILKIGADDAAAAVPLQKYHFSKF